MNFSGSNLTLVRAALRRAINDINTEIGLHPAPAEYEEEIEQLEGEREEYEVMLARIVAKEGG